MATLKTVQKIRLLVGDKDAASDGTGDVFGFTDDEVNFAYNEAVAREGEATGDFDANVYLAAADLLDAAAAKSAQTAKSITVGNYSNSTASQGDALHERAEALRKRAYEQPAGGAAEIAWTDAEEAQIIFNKYEREA